MPSISLCMIVKNEERNLPRCLDSVQDLVDEIVIVDTGSSDATRAAALRYTHRVYDFTWRDDFAAARNFAFDQGTMDYLMWLDADDVLEEADRERFRREKAGLDPAVDVVMMPYHTAFDGTGAPAFTCERERLVRREAGLRWEGEVHEVIAPTGRVAHWTAAVSHRKTGPGDPDRNLRIYEGLLAAGRSRPGRGFTMRGNCPPTAGRRKPPPNWSCFYRMAAAGWKTRFRHAWIWRAAMSGWGGRKTPFPPWSGACGTGRPGRKHAVNWDVFSSEGRTGSAPPTGTDGRWTPRTGGSPAALNSPAAGTISRCCSCACATTTWGIGRWRRNTMSGRGRSSPTVPP